jgi:hypothetical protein
MSSSEEEQLQTLPVGHPQAGYTNYDRSPVLGTGTVPADEQAIYDERTAADEAEKEAVAQHEHEVATTEPGPVAEETPPASKSTSTSSSKSSSS